MNIPVRWAYPAVFIGVCGHASSEFFAKLTAVAGPEVSVWRYVHRCHRFVALVSIKTR